MVNKTIRQVDIQTDQMGEVAKKKLQDCVFMLVAIAYNTSPLRTHRSNFRVP